MGYLNGAPKRRRQLALRARPPPSDLVFIPGCRWRYEPQKLGLPGRREECALLHVLPNSRAFIRCSCSREPVAIYIGRVTRVFLCNSYASTSGAGMSGSQRSNGGSSDVSKVRQKNSRYVALNCLCVHEQTMHRCVTRREALHATEGIPCVIEANIAAEMLVCPRRTGKVSLRAPPSSASTWKREICEGTCAE